MFAGKSGPEFPIPKRSAVNMMEHPWEGAMEPFKIFGNTYFVGTEPASSHLIDTGSGLILLDSGYMESLYLVLESIRKLGFDPREIRYIIHSHGHIDHAAATRALVEMVRAETFLGEDDRGMVTGENQLSWAPEYEMSFDGLFEPDHLLRDGDRITLGNVSIDCVATPGHTAGDFSFFWNGEENGRRLRFGTMGGAGVNSMSSEYLRKYHIEFQKLREKFRKSILRCRKESVDIFIGNHVGHNDTQGKYQRLLQGFTDVFIDPGEWNRFLDNCTKNIERLETEDPL